MRTPSCGASVVYPFGQLLIAVMSLAAWVALAELEVAADQVTVVNAYTWGTPAALLVTLDLPFVLPNAFVGIPVSHRRGSGLWSSTIRVSRTSSGVVLVAGVLVSLASTGSWFGLSIVFSSVLAMAILVAQLARIVRSIPLMAASGLAQLSLPVGWLATSSTGFSTEERTFLSEALLIVIWFVMVSRIHGMARGYQRASWNTGVGKSMLLVPHLMAFGTLLQGPRVLATLFGPSSLVVDTHIAMLIFGGGATFLAATNSMVSVDLQTADASKYANIARRCGWVYAALGSVASVSCLLALSIAHELNVVNLNAWPIIAISTALAALASYYAASATLLRQGFTWALSMCSVLSIMALFLLYATTGDLWLSFLVAMSGLALIAISEQRLLTRASDRSAGLISGLALLSCLPVGVVATTVTVAAMR